MDSEQIQRCTIVEAVCLAVDGVGLLLDVLTVVLDLSFLLVSSLLASLAWLLAFICNLPHTVLTGLPHLRRGAWVSLLALIEAVARFTSGGCRPCVPYRTAAILVWRA
ncbi:hypothetical protein CB1_000539003 [Camelus ferus]|nr:hypothetical protein CB1_000539003 [Camelus ferus]